MSPKQEKQKTIVRCKIIKLLKTGGTKKILKHPGKKQTNMIQKSKGKNYPRLFQKSEASRDNIRRKKKSINF